MHTLGKRKKRKKRRRKTKSLTKTGKCLHSHAEKVVFSYNLQRGKLASFWRNLAFVTTTASKVHAIGKRKTQKKTAQNKEPTKDRKILAFPRRKSCVFVQLAKGHKLASFWRNLDFVTATAGKVHAIGKRKTQKKTAQTPSFRYRFNASKSVPAVQRFTFKQFSILLQTRFERDLPQKD